MYSETELQPEAVHKVQMPPPESPFRVYGHDMKEAFFADDPWRKLKDHSHFGKFLLALKYIFPILEWLPKYNFSSFRSDVIAGITIATLAIPQGISYAKLADLSPKIGLYGSFVPPLVYAAMGSSRDLAVGQTAIVSTLMASIFSPLVSPTEEPTKYLSLILSATLLCGIFQAALGILRLGFIIDFLSHATLVGFMGGVATSVSLQQLKGILGLTTFSTKSDVVSILKSSFTQTHSWHWQTIVIAIVSLIILMAARIMGKKKPRLFVVSALAPLVTLILGTIFVKFVHGEKHGIPVLGKLKKGLNSPTLNLITFNSQYIGSILKAALLACLVTLTEGIAIGRSFANLKKYPLDGNKEMSAIGIMNIIGSLTNCYITTGVLSRTAVNFNAGCKTAMTNVVMAIVVMLTLLFLIPLFYHTPIVVLSAIIVAALVPLINVGEAYHLWQVDKYDFVICLGSFLGVVFHSVEIGLAIGVGLSILRVLFPVMRPHITQLGQMPGTKLYRNIEQYSATTRLAGILLLRIESPLYYASTVYLQERTTRWVDSEQELQQSLFNAQLRFLILDLSAVTVIDSSGVNALTELHKTLQARSIQLAMANPNENVMRRLHASKYVDDIVGANWLFLTIAEAVSACKTTVLEASERKRGSEPDPESAAEAPAENEQSS